MAEKDPLLSGLRFGELKVIERDFTKYGPHYKCECDCGNLHTVAKGNLLSGMTKRCPACASQTITARNKTTQKPILVGQVFDFLTVISHKKGATDCYECLCECERVEYKTHKYLNGSNRRSKGCVDCCARLENAKKGVRYRSDKVSKQGFVGVKLINGRFSVSCKKQYVGCFATDTEAAKAYDEKARELYGESAILNFPDHAEGDL